MTARIHLKPGKDRSTLRRHPWIFSGAIARTEGEPGDGDRVEVAASTGQIIAHGHYQTGSIAVKILRFGAESPGDGLWRDGLAAARAVRASVGLLSDPATDSFRLCFGEGDGLPGLVVDVYGSTAVIQAHSPGVQRERAAIGAALADVMSDRVKAVCFKSAHSSESEWLLGGPSEVIATENGHRFQVDVEKGQKTGFFLDQRENRMLCGRHARGRRVLNAFCYTGGFSVYAATGGASSVTSVDSSRPAVAMAARNLERNGIDPAANPVIVADVLDHLRDGGPDYELIVLDPPAYAKHLSARHHAVQGYKRLNYHALKRLAPGGLLHTFSCSQVVDRPLFESTLLAAAIEAGRTVRVLHHLSAGPDHPASIHHPEGQYLKGLVLHVE